MSNTSSHNTPAVQKEQQVPQEQRTAEARDAFTALIKVTATPIDNELQERAKNIHFNEKALAKQTKDLQNQTKDLAKQTDSMESFVTKSRKQLASFDNLESLSTDFDNQLAELEELLNIVEQGEPSQQRVLDSQPNNDQR